MGAVRGEGESGRPALWPLPQRANSIDLVARRSRQRSSRGLAVAPNQVTALTLKPLQPMQTAICASNTLSKMEIRENFRPFFAPWPGFLFDPNPIRGSNSPLKLDWPLTFTDWFLYLITAFLFHAALLFLSGGYALSTKTSEIKIKIYYIQILPPLCIIVWLPCFECDLWPMTISLSNNEIVYIFGSLMPTFNSKAFKAYVVPGIICSLVD
jgi:hypothetical protein